MDGDFRFVREPSGNTLRTIDVVMHHGGKFVRDPILRYEEVNEPCKEVHLYFEHNVVDVLEEISLDEVRELERKRMQEESHRGEEADQGEVGDQEEDDDQGRKDDQGQEDDQEEERDQEDEGDQEKEGDQEDDIIEDSSYKLGLDDNNSEEFDDGRVDSGGGEGVQGGEGEVQGGEESTLSGKKMERKCNEKSSYSTSKSIKKKGYKSKERFKDKTTAEMEHMFVGTFSFVQEMEGSTTDEIYRRPATFSSAVASATTGAAAGASTSDANFEEEQVCEGYETDEMKSIHDEDSDNEVTRPLIGLDGCFLKRYYDRQLLSAMSQDGNNSFYVIAYGIMNVENKENWIWFLENLVNDLRDPVEKGFTCISDRQKGLDSDLELVCHGAPHRYCCRHIFANFIKKFSNTPEYERAFWACAKATAQRYFAEAMMVLDRLNKDAAKWLDDIPTDSKMVKTQALIAKSQGPLCKQIQMKLDKLHQKAIYWTPHWSGDPNRAKFERKPGKPKTKRKKAPEEDSNPHKIKRKLGPPSCSRYKQVGHKKTSCKANLGDGDTAAATNETRPSDVPVDGANEETIASQVPGEGGSATAGDNANDAPAVAQDGHFGPIPSQPELQSAQPLQTDHHSTTHDPCQYFPYADDFANIQVTPPGGIAFRPPPMRPSMMPHPRALITKKTIEGTSAGTAQRFAAFMNTGVPRPPQ
ncbi:hypothetical protein CRG98_027573 [Punica granatum]|uniref:MULE transposase domain-containing protein n=1 Tax=Punica granatum TaxID=22663 RepID=A0A2I0J720_PUNGR|nr:hypothetical protein CRG98_027573 [Punica granatum]